MQERTSPGSEETATVPKKTVTAPRVVSHVLRRVFWFPTQAMASVVFPNSRDFVQEGPEVSFLHCPSPSALAGQIPDVRISFGYTNRVRLVRRARRPWAVDGAVDQGDRIGCCACFPRRAYEPPGRATMGRALPTSPGRCAAPSGGARSRRTCTKRFRAYSLPSGATAQSSLHTADFPAPEAARAQCGAAFPNGLGYASRAKPSAQMHCLLMSFHHALPVGSRGRQLICASANHNVHL